MSQTIFHINKIYIVNKVDIFRNYAWCVQLVNFYSSSITRIL